MERFIAWTLGLWIAGKTLQRVSTPRASWDPRPDEGAGERAVRITGAVLCMVGLVALAVWLDPSLGKLVNG
jgi:hypothetical protein